MAKMYIANCTNQVQDFQYRLPEKRKLFKQSIEIGAQIQISGDLSTPDIEAILEQHSIYGLTHEGEIDRSRAFVGLCYSLDRPVNMNRVRSALEHNHAVLDARGTKIRQEAAVAVHNQINQNTNGQLDALEMTVQEEDSKANQNSPTLHEINRVDPKAEGAPGPGRSRARATPRASRRKAA